MAVDLIGFGIVLPLLPRYADELGASPTVVGLLVASFSLAQLVFAPIMGRLSDRIGRKPVLIVSLFGTAIGSLITGLAGSVWVLFLGRVIDGASGASVSVAQAAAADLAEPRDRPRLMGLLGAAFGVGFVAGPILGSLGALRGPHVPFFLAALIAGVNALVAIKRLPETRPVGVVPVDAAVDAERVARLPSLEGPGLAEPAHLDLAPPTSDAPTGRDAASIAGPTTTARHAIVRLIVGAFSAVAAFAAFEATFSLLVEERFGLSLAATGAVFAVIGIELVVVQGLLVGPVSERLGERGTLVAGLAINTVGLVLLVPDLGWAGLVPAVGLLVLGQGLTTPTLSSAVAGLAGAQRGRWLGWQQSAGALARVVGPAAAGALFEHVGPGVPYAAGAALMVLAIAVVGGMAPAQPSDGMATA